MDTSQTESSLCLVSQEKVLCTLALSSQKQQLEKLIPSLEWMLKQTHHTKNELAAIGVTTGGGSFTGLRLGISTAKALAYALKIPLIGIPTLDAYVFSAASHAGYYMPLLDVRKKQVYGALYHAAAVNIKSDVDLEMENVYVACKFSPFIFSKLAGIFTCRASEVSEKLSPSCRHKNIVVFGSALEVYENELREISPNYIFLKQHGAPVAAAVALYARDALNEKNIPPESVFSVSLSYSHNP